jgi:hypothetical protein
MVLLVSWLENDQNKPKTKKGISMIKSLHLSKRAMLLAAFLAATQIGFAQLLQLQAINVDNNGNFIQIEWNTSVTGTKVDASAPLVPSTTVYLGGLFSQVNTSIYLISTKQYYIPNYKNGVFQGNSLVTGLPLYPGTLTANNVVKLVYNPGTLTLQISALTAGGYGVNGCNGEVLALALSSAGDLYAGGLFSEAGGFPYSTGIGVYLASGGWQTSYIFSAFDVVSSLTWVNSTELEVNGSFGSKTLWQVDGPIYPFDHSSDHINVSYDRAFWHTYTTGAFNGGYWSASE